MLMINPYLFDLHCRTPIRGDPGLVSGSIHTALIWMLKQLARLCYSGGVQHDYPVVIALRFNSLFFTIIMRNFSH
jgi:ABC-type microcin C transport system permease subunit YejB